MSTVAPTFLQSTLLVSNREITMRLRSKAFLISLVLSGWHHLFGAVFGNDSGIAHIAAAVATPSVVIFGSSNRDHWRPWTDAPNEIVFEPFSCQPCPGYECKEFGEPRCILSVKPGAVFDAIERVLRREYNPDNHKLDSFLIY